MKTRLLFLLALTAALTAPAKDRVVTRPAFADGNLNFRPTKVILGKTSTTVGFSVLGMGGWTLAAESHLVAGGKTYRMTRATVYERKADGTVVVAEPFDPEVHYTYRKDSVSAEFEPLDSKAKTFDFIEKEGSNFNTYGIRLDGKQYPFLLGKPKPFPYPKDEPLGAIEPKWGRSAYTLNMCLFDGTEQQPTMFGLNNCFSKDRFMGYAGRTYAIEAGLPYFAPVAAPYPRHQFIILMVPGYETTVTVDKTAYLASETHAAKKPVPTHRIIQFDGPLADLQQVFYDEAWLYHKFNRLAPDTLWKAVQEKIREIEANKSYSRRQKDFGRLRAESQYLRRYVQCVVDGQASLQDSHAADLVFLKDGRSFYLVDSDAYLPYARANAIGGPVTEWMEGFARAKNLANRMRNMELMPESAFDTIPALFQKELRALNDSTRVAVERLRTAAGEVKVMDTPDCTGREFIDRVVSENPGVVLFFDFWATWCGPCMNGIRAMEPLKKEYAGRPIRFVYVTNESSPANQWTAQIASMPGIHYRLPDAVWGAIPGVQAIPQYYIYDKQGRRFYEHTGFSTIDPLRQKIEEALK